MAIINQINELTRFLSLESVHQTVGDPSSASPGVDAGTLLTGPHVSDSALVPEVAHLGVVASRGTILNMK